MAKIELTVRQIMNLGLWTKVCEYKGWSEWIYNEGQIDDNEIVEFDDQFKKETEINFFEAIAILKEDGEVKVEFDDGGIKYLSMTDDLMGITFDSLFEAKFYINYE